MSEREFKLNTESMDEAAKSCQELSDMMKNLKDELINSESHLLFYWEGKGRNEFEKQFRLLTSRLSDVTETLMETAENILTAEASYIQADVDLAKQIDGKTQGEITSADPYVSDVFN